ncbi:MAG TPA: hypothetical protein VGE83_00085 [Terracidiphilus sp.]
MHCWSTIWLQKATPHFVEVLESLAVNDLRQLFAGERLALELARIELAVAHRRRGTPSSMRVRRVERNSTRTTSQLMASRPNAPITPPLTELSSPMMTFCTVFDNDSNTIRSKGLSCASSLLPNRRYRITCTR